MNEDDNQHILKCELALCRANEFVHTVLLCYCALKRSVKNYGYLCPLVLSTRLQQCCIKVVKSDWSSIELQVYSTVFEFSLLVLDAAK